MNDEEELNLMRSWFSQTFKESFSVLLDTFRDPKKASIDMNRLERHSIYQLRRTVKIALVGGSK